MRILAALLVRRRAVLALWIALAAAALPGLARLSSDDSAEVFFVHDADRLELYRRFQMDFGRDRSVRLVVSGPALATREGLAWLGELETAAGALRGVFGAAGLATHHRHRPGGWPPADPDAFWRRARRDPLDTEAGLIVGPALGEAEMGDPEATVLVALYNLPPEKQNETLGRLEDLLAGAPAGVRTAIVGLPVLQRAMDDEMVAFGTRRLPLLALVALGLLALAFRRPTALLLPWASTGVCLVVVFGLRGWLGLPLNLVEIVLAPLLLVIALAAAVHVQMRYMQMRCVQMRSRERIRVEPDPVAAVLATYREKGWPVLWTGVTTLAGFGSLAWSEVPPVRSLGLWSAGALALITLAMLTFFPALLASVGGRLDAGGSRPGGWSYERWASGRGRAWAAWATRRRSRGPLAVGFGVLAVVALAGLPRLHMDTDLIGYFPAGHPARTELESLEARGVGTAAAELVLTAEPAGSGVGSRGEPSTTPAPFAGPGGLDELARLTGDLRRVPGVMGVVSAGELWRSTRGERPREGPGEGLEETPDATWARLLATPELADLLRVLRTDDGLRARVSVLLPMRGFEDLDPVLGRLQDVAARAVAEIWPGSRMRVDLTGRYPLVLAALRRVLRTMWVSFSMTLAIVAAVFAALLRSLRLTLVALIPNLWPVLCAVGAMGWLGAPLDSTTVMIAAVVLGLAVDDTLHTLGRFRRETGDPASAAVATLEHTAPAHLLTTAVLAAGFAVCGLSSFVPIARFGALTALALVLALAADLLLVPALLAGLVGSRSG